jgi:hypothetical protein
MHKRISKPLAVFLIVLMMLVQPGIIIPVSAGPNSAELPEFSVAKHQEALPSVTTDTKYLTDSQRVNQFINQLIPYYLNGGIKNGPEWLRTTDISFTFTQDYKPLYSIETIQPFKQANEKGQLWFWQGRYANSSDITAVRNFKEHRVDSPSLLGWYECKREEVEERDDQLRLF